MSISCGGVEVNTVSQTMAEMQMTDLRRYDAVTICALFGMPPEVAGLNPEAQYAHGPAAQRMVTDTVGPLLSFIAAHLNDYVLPEFAGKAHKAVQAARAGLRTGLRRRTLRRTLAISARKIRNVNTTTAAARLETIEDLLIPGSGDDFSVVPGAEKTDPPLTDGQADGQVLDRLATLFKTHGG